MAKKVPIPSLQPVRPMDPEWRIKFKSLKELGSEKRNSRSTNKLNSQRKLRRDQSA